MSVEKPRGCRRLISGAMVAVAILIAVEIAFGVYLIATDARASAARAAKEAATLALVLAIFGALLYFVGRWLRTDRL